MVGGPNRLVDLVVIVLTIKRVFFEGRTQHDVGRRVRGKPDARIPAPCPGPGLAPSRDGSPVTVGNSEGMARRWRRSVAAGSSPRRPTPVLFESLADFHDGVAVIEGHRLAGTAARRAEDDRRFAKEEREASMRLRAEGR